MGSDRPRAGAKAFDTLHGHVREVLGELPAVVSAKRTGSADDEVRVLLPGPTNAEAIALVERARLDPRYASWMQGIKADPTALNEARDRFHELLAQLGTDLDKPYAESDGESGHLVARASEEGTELLVLLAVLSASESGGHDRLAQLATPEEDRARRDRFLDEISAQYRRTLTGPARAIAEYLSARRSGDVTTVNWSTTDLLDALRTLRRRVDGDDADAWAEQAFDLILDKIEQRDGRLRAEINAAKTMAWLEKATHLNGERARIRRSDRVQDTDRTASLDQPLIADDDETLLDRLADVDLGADLAAMLEMQDLLARADLTTPQLTALQLRNEGKRYREIGAAMGIKTSTAGVHLRDARTKIRRVVET